MNQVIDFFKKLFDSSDWPPRWHCGRWTEFHGWLYIISDLLIWSAYFAIPVVIIRYISKRQDVRFVRLYFLFAAFILACGATHFLDAVAFWVPAYRLNALFRLITGGISWITVFYLVKFLPVIFSLKPQKELEREIEQRKRSEEKFRGLLEAAPDAMVIADEKGEIALVNKQTEKLFGYTKEELIGQPVEILIPAVLHQRHVEHREKYIKDPHVRAMGAGIELEALKKDGSRFPVEISLSPLVTEEGILVSASVRDITDRKRSEEKFRGLLEAAPDAMIIANEKGEIALINKQTEKLFEYTKEELIGKPVEILIPASLHQYHIGHREKYIKDPHVRAMGAGMELQALKKDGSKFPVEISLSPLETEEGILVSASVRDITDRKRSEEKFRGLLEAAPDAMIIVNEKGEIALINKQTEKLFEYTKEELIGKPVEILIPADLHNKHINDRSSYFENPKVRSMGVGLELFALRKDGTQIPVEISLSPLVTEEGTLISASVRDISERIKADAILKKTKKDFQLLISIVKDYAIILLDENGLVASWNTGAEHIKGYTAEEIIGKPMDIFYTAEQQRNREPQRNLQMALQKGHYETESLLVRKDGSSFYANIVLTSVMDEKGKLIGYSKVTKDITEKRKAEERIRFLASIADNIQDPVITSDNNFCITRWNQAAEKLLEWKSEEVIGKTTMEILKTGYPDQSREKILGALDEKGFWHGELIYYTKSGRVVNVISSASKLKDAEDNEAGILVLVKDITARKKAEDTLSKLNEELEQKVIERTREVHKNEKRFRALIENNYDMISLMDESFKIIYRSPSSTRITGWTDEDLQTGGTEKFHPDDLENAKNTVGQVLITPGKAVKVSFRSRHKDGHYLWMEGSVINLLQDEDVKAIVFNFRDVTERIEAEEKIKQTLNEKNIILESIGDAFFAVDKTWTVTYWNRVAETALNVPRHTIIGKKLWDIFSDSIDSLSYKKYHQAIETNHVVHFEDYYVALNKWYEISAYPSENGLSVYFKDITERKKAAEEINKLNTELEAKVIKRTEELQVANKELEAFTYSVSHDLRAPLRGIIGFTAILEEDYSSQLDDEARRITSVIKTNTLKMGNLIDDLLAFSRMGRKEIEKTAINANNLVQQIIAEAEKQNTAGTIEWIIHALHSFKGDINTMRQVWINLISNAVKYSGGKEKRRIEIGSYSEGNKVIFFIKDNGAGFDSRYSDKLFKVFQRLHGNDEFEGTGVGLAIVEKIISRHGGKVWAEGEVDKGACFYFSLPAG